MKKLLINKFLSFGGPPVYTEYEVCRHCERKVNKTPAKGVYRDNFGSTNCPSGKAHNV